MNTLPKIYNTENLEIGEAGQLLLSFKSSAPSVLKASGNILQNEIYMIPKLNIRIKILTEHDDNYHISFEIIS